MEEFIITRGIPVQIWEVSKITVNQKNIDLLNEDLADEFENAPLIDAKFLKEFIEKEGVLGESNIILIPKDKEFSIEQTLSSFLYSYLDEWFIEETFWSNNHSDSEVLDSPSYWID